MSTTILPNNKRNCLHKELHLTVKKRKLQSLQRQDSVSSTHSNNSNPSTPVNTGIDIIGPNFAAVSSSNIVQQQQSAGGGHSNSGDSAESNASDEAALSPALVNVQESENQPERNSNGVQNPVDIINVQQESQKPSQNSSQTVYRPTEGDSSTKLSINKELIKGVFEVLHVTDDEEPTFIVRNVKTREYGLCREIPMDKYKRYMQLYERFFAENCDEDEHVLQRAWPEKTELFMTVHGKCYHVSPRHYGTLHSHVIDKKKLSEEETRLFYYQICEIVAYCHDRGIVVRDVKLRKFVFVDEQKTQLRLDDLDEFVVCPKVDEDLMSDRHGCPAYVSPEILDLSSKVYAGRPADVWGLGVLLYVLLMGRYPFYDKTPTGLFGKIRSAKFLLNEHSGVSFELRWLIRSLLRKSPEERPSVREILAHPWLVRTAKSTPPDSYVSLSADSLADLSKKSKIEDNSSDQCVPCLGPVIVRMKPSTNKSVASFFHEPRDQEVFQTEI